nr:hypothetical protein GCM10025732_29810 [Glycomyces mayteni]
MSNDYIGSLNAARDVLDYSRLWFESTFGTKEICDFSCETLYEILNDILPKSSLRRNSRYRNMQPTGELALGSLQVGNPWLKKHSQETLGVGL